MRAVALHAIATAMFLLSSHATGLSSQEPPGEATPGAPAVTPANARSIELEGQLQVQAASTSVDTTVGWDAELRRIRLTAVGDAGAGFSGALQMEFGTDRVRVRDAIVEYEPSPQVSLRVGQFKIPFNGIEMTSSKRLLVIERDARIRGLDAETTSGFLADEHLAARNRGVMAIFRLADERLVVHAGGWQGNGENPENDDGKEVAARIEYALIPESETSPRPLVLGAAGVANGYFGGPRDTLAVLEGDTTRLDDPQYAAAFEAWAEFGKYLVPGLHVAANLIAGENPTEFRARGRGIEFESFLGVQGWGEYLIELEADVLTGWAPAFRADRFDPNTDADDDGNLLLTPGLNLYFGETVKAQLNYDVLVPEDDGRDTESAFRIQTQLLF